MRGVFRPSWSVAYTSAAAGRLGFESLDAARLEPAVALGERRSLADDQKGRWLYRELALRAREAAEDGAYDSLTIGRAVLDDRDRRIAVVTALDERGAELGVLRDAHVESERLPWAKLRDARRALVLRLAGREQHGLGDAAQR